MPAMMMIICLLEMVMVIIAWLLALLIIMIVMVLLMIMQTMIYMANGLVKRLDINDGIMYYVWWPIGKASSGENRVK